MEVGTKFVPTPCRVVYGSTCMIGKICKVILPYGGGGAKCPHLFQLMIGKIYKVILSYGGGWTKFNHPFIGVLLYFFQWYPIFSVDLTIQCSFHIFMPQYLTYVLTAKVRLVSRSDNLYAVFSSSVRYSNIIRTLFELDKCIHFTRNIYTRNDRSIFVRVTVRRYNTPRSIIFFTDGSTCMIGKIYKVILPYGGGVAWPPHLF